MSTLNRLPAFTEARRRRYLKRQLRRRGIDFDWYADTATLARLYLALPPDDEDDIHPGGPAWLAQDAGPDDEPDCDGEEPTP